MRNVRIIGGVAVVGAAGLLMGAAGSRDGAASEDATTLPYVQWAGHQTQRVEAGFVLVRDEAAWRGLWAEHTGVKDSPMPLERNAAPKVDFSRCMVLAYFAGPGVNGDGEVVRAVDEVGGAVRVRFSTDSFQTAFGMDDGKAPAAEPVKFRPFGIWVLAATDKPLLIEKPAPALKAEPKRWEEVKRFEGR